MEIGNIVCESSSNMEDFADTNMLVIDILHLRPAMFIFLL